MLHHALVGLFGRSLALASLLSQQPLWCREQRPTETILPSVLIYGIDEVFGYDVCTHLQTTYIGIELRTHVIAREVAGGTQLTGYHPAMFTQGS